ncbi:MAG: hypothetical protein EOM68_04380 [Spirochaetia bacterium]|jgi:hypothetical protein|nr:hypothetical protein [Spirochaetia bacterium]
MMQIYLMSIAYLVLGAGFLLSDMYGGRFSLLLSLRYIFRTNKGFQKVMIILGFALSLALGFFPMSPGPRLLGDLIPMANTILLTLWYLFHALKHADEQEPLEDQSVLESTGRYFEKNKRNFGFITGMVAVLHFLVPMSVLL